MTASYRFTVSGRVQGVFFRQSAADRARQLQLSGWVCNLADGRVQGLACGTADALEALRLWLQQGPPAARVDRLEWEPAAEQPQGPFEVRR